MALMSPWCLEVILARGFEQLCWLFGSLAFLFLCVFNCTVARHVILHTFSVVDVVYNLVDTYPYFREDRILYGKLYIP